MPLSWNEIRHRVEYLFALYEKITAPLVAAAKPKRRKGAKLSWSGIVRPAVMEAMETLKYLTGVGRNLKGRLLLWSGADGEFRVLKVRRDPNCPTCSQLR